MSFFVHIDMLLSWNMISNAEISETEVQLWIEFSSYKSNTVKTRAKKAYAADICWIGIFPFDFTFIASNMNNNNNEDSWFNARNTLYYLPHDINTATQSEHFSCVFRIYMRVFPVCFWVDNPSWQQLNGFHDLYAKLAKYVPPNTRLNIYMVSSSNINISILTEYTWINHIYFPFGCLSRSWRPE